MKELEYRKISMNGLRQLLKSVDDDYSKKLEMGISMFESSVY